MKSRPKRQVVMLQNLSNKIKALCQAEDNSTITQERVDFMADSEKLRISKVHKNEQHGAKSANFDPVAMTKQRRLKNFLKLNSATTERLND